MAPTRVRTMDSLSTRWDGLARRDRRRHRSTPACPYAGPAVQVDGGLSIFFQTGQLMDGDAGLSKLGDEGSRPKPSHLSILENLNLLQLLASPKKPDLEIRTDSAIGMYRSTQPSTMGKYTVYDADGSTLELDVPHDDGSSSQNKRLLAKFFDPEVIKLAFSKPETRARLAHFVEHSITGPERNQCVADMKFLAKCDEHTRLVSALTSNIADITATHTSAASPHPVPLPFAVSNKITRDTNHISKTTAPLLTNLFRDARSCAADRLAHTLYPEFVKHQLTQCTQNSLSTQPSLPSNFRSAYPGLGTAFALASPSLSDNPILLTSDEALHPRGRPLLADLPAGSAATLRLREALALGREAVELVVSHASSQTPFWSLFFVCPLYERGGALRFHFGAQINVSASMGDQGRDVLRVLSFCPDVRAAPTEIPTTTTTKRRTFAGLFSRRERSPEARGLVISGPLPKVKVPAPSLFTSAELEEPASAARSTHTAVLERPFDRSSTPYGSFVVLQWEGGATMRIVFCSGQAQEQIGGGGEDDDVVGYDVFDVLLGRDGAAGDKKAVGELQAKVVKGIAVGETVVGEVVVGGVLKEKVGGMWRGGTTSVLGGGDKGKRASGSSEPNAGVGGKVKKLVTHWTPLKDDEGKVEWVVLVLTPAAVRG